MTGDLDEVRKDEIRGGIGRIRVREVVLEIFWFGRWNGGRFGFGLGGLDVLTSSVLMSFHSGDAERRMVAE